MSPHFCNYVWFDTGIEYQATKEHLTYLEDRYNIDITKERAKCPVPLSSKRYGVPFLSKHISEMIYRLQKHDFNWEDDSFENLIKKYPKCKSALKWWTNEGDSKWFGIQRNVWLKEYMVKNPPQFKICGKDTLAELSIKDEYKDTLFSLKQNNTMDDCCTPIWNSCATVAPEN